MISSSSQRDLHSSLTNSRPWRVLPYSGHLHTLLKYRASSGRSFWSCSSQGCQPTTSVSTSGTFNSLFQSQEYSGHDQHHIFLGQPAEALQLSGGFRCKEQEMLGKAHCTHMRTLAPIRRLSLLSCPSKPFAFSKYHTVYCAFWGEILEASFWQSSTGSRALWMTSTSLRAISWASSQYRPACFQAAYLPAQSFSRRLLLQSSPEEMGGVCELQALLSQTLLPLGLPGNRWVAAQGLSLEYLTMIKDNINIIWELVGLE